MTYQCPLCHQPLNQVENRFQCASNHQFDIAKEGYVNLIPPHHKRSKQPGDNKEMMQARRRFLEADHYSPLATLVAELADCHTPEAGTLLDIGCGEGYYTSRIQTQLMSKHSKVFGLDISKVAVRYASKRYADCQFSVASSYRLPFNDASIDALVRIYAPCKEEELRRVVKPGGVIITVTPGSRHLFQLREAIYGDVRLHDEQAEDLKGFTLVKQDKLNYSMELTGPLAHDLLEMTPFAWKAKPDFKTELFKRDHYLCDASFVISLYQRDNT